MLFKAANEWLGSERKIFIIFYAIIPHFRHHSLTGHTYIFAECYETMMTTTTTIILFYLSLSPHNHIIIIFFVSHCCYSNDNKAFLLLLLAGLRMYQKQWRFIMLECFFSLSGHFSTVLCMVRLARTKELWFIYSRARGINGMNSVKKLIFLFTAIINFQWNFNYENCMHIAIIIFLSSYFFTWFIRTK